jgi:hypothetical protein
MPSPKHFIALACRDTSLSEHQQIQLFITGQGDPLCTDMALQQPVTLDDAVIFAHAYEQLNALWETTTVSSSCSTSCFVPRSGASTVAGSNASNLASSSASVTKLASSSLCLSLTEIAPCRKDGKCFHCDEFFTDGHRGHCKHLFIIVVIDEEDNMPAVGEDEPTISLHVLTGIQFRSNRTMQLLIHVNSASLMALLDSRSTHNFINEQAATRACITLLGTRHLRVAMANDDKLTSSGCCRNMQLVIHGKCFTIDCYRLALGSYDMVLGVQWLESLGPILWDFRRGTLAFVHDGHRVVWSATSPRPAPSSLAMLLVVEGDLMNTLLQEFEGLFQEPTGLPPARSCSHKIHLLPGTAPVAVRPYRYAHAQKVELERQCDTMLLSGVIRPSSSAFLAPVLLVKKSDTSWRFCVDYRALNEKTMKDKFPIPVVEELLDELQGAQFFTKLDLRSGCHQVLMHPDDVIKTTFRIHQRLFEFLVMSFGLLNAPATF